MTTVIVDARSVVRETTRLKGPNNARVEITQAVRHGRNDGKNVSGLRFAEK